MPATVTHSPPSALRELPERSHAMAKADLRLPERSSFRADLGRCIDRARTLMGWSLKELAGKVERDERQVARWIAGTERQPFDLLFAVTELRGALVIALASLSDDVTVETTLHVRRIA